MNEEQDPQSFQKEEYIVEEEVTDDQDNPEIFSCKYCEYKTEDVDNLDEHIITHEEAVLDDTDPQQYLGKFTGVLLENKRRRVRRMLPAFYEEYSNAPEKLALVCPFCGYQSMIQSDMTEHVNGHKEPIQIPIYACSECHYSTGRKCDMSKHLLTHCKSPSVPMYKCNACHYSTKRKSDLKKHLYCHTEPPFAVYACELCTYVSNRARNLNKHLISHNILPDMNAYVYNCTECGYVSKRVKNLLKHVLLHSDRTVKGRYRCPKCDYVNAEATYIAKHILTQCQFTKEVFPKSRSIEDYILINEKDLHFYELDNDIEAVEVLDESEIDQKPFIVKKRSALNDTGSVTVKRIYVKTENVEAIGQSHKSNKVVVLTGFEAASSTVTE